MVTLMFSLLEYRAAGKARGELIFLVLLSAPRILDGQTDITDIVFNDVNINCSFEGALPANVTWYVIIFNKCKFFGKS